MKRLFIIDDSLSNKISYYLIVAFLIALPFDRFFSEWLLIVFCLHTLIQLKIERLNGLKKKSVWITGSVFIVAIVGVTYSGYKADGLRVALQQLAILLFPLFLSVTNLNLAKYKWQLLEIFAITCLVTVLYLYFEAFRVIHYFRLPFASIGKTGFINQNFTAPIGLHATYLSMYVLLSMCIFLLLTTHKVHRRYPYFFSLVVLAAGMLQMSSRAGILAALVIFVFLVPFFLLQGKKRMVFFVGALVTVAIAIMLIDQPGTFNKRLVHDLGNDLSEYRDPGDLTESRMARWNLEWQLIRKSPVLGYGSGSEEFVLKETYFRNKFYRSFLLGLNSHSQFFSFLLNEGLLGLLIYLYLFYYGFRTALSQRDFVFMAFLLILFTVSFSENILDVSKGVLFYAFFLPFFLMTESRQKACLSV